MVDDVASAEQLASRKALVELATALVVAYSVVRQLPNNGPAPAAVFWHGVARAADRGATLLDAGAAQLGRAAMWARARYWDQAGMP